MNEQKSRKRPSEQKTKEPTGSEKTSNDRGRKHRREKPPSPPKLTAAPIERDHGMKKS